jgi:drug/metabolite transporter (DMT)-like permease
VSQAVRRSPRAEQLVGVALVLASAVLFGSGPFFANAAFDAGMVALAILAWRFLFAALLSWVLVLATPAGRASLRALTRRRAGALVLLGALYVGNSGTYVGALATVSVSLTSMIVYLYPAMVAVLATWFGRPLVGRRAWVALGISTAGVFLAIGGVPEGEMPPLGGLLLAIASPIIYACWIILSARLAGERPTASRNRSEGPTIPPSDVEGLATDASAPTGAAAATAMMTSATAAGFALLVLVTGGSLAPSDVPSGAWPALVAFGSCSALAVQAFYAGVRRIGGARASLLSTVEPVYTITLATLLFGETLTTVQLVGGALVIGGVILAETGTRRRDETRAGTTSTSDETEPVPGPGVREAISGG